MNAPIKVYKIANKDPFKVNAKESLNDIPIY